MFKVIYPNDIRNIEVKETDGIQMTVLCGTNLILLFSVKALSSFALF